MDTFDAAAFNNRFDEISRNIMEQVRGELIENVKQLEPWSHDDVTPAMIIAQIIMNTLDDGGVSENGGVIAGHLTTGHKAALVRIADYMGPDWAQALYHAAVFITKVA